MPSSHYGGLTLHSVPDFHSKIVWTEQILKRKCRFVYINVCKSKVQLPTQNINTRSVSHTYETSYNATSLPSYNILLILLTYTRNILLINESILTQK